MRLLIATTIAFFALWPSVEDVQDLLNQRTPATDSAVAESEPVSEAPVAISLSAEAESQTSPAVEGGSEVPISFRDPRIVSSEELCETLASAAQLNDLPVAFFLRLIWQESRFIASAVSRAGAQGMAQFMPATAAEHGLADPFDPLQALPASARFLNALRKEFGNLGLAAAAYNAGSGRIREWIEKRGRLPKETHDYVLNITGHAADTWVGGAPENPQYRIPRRAPCRHMLSDEEIAAADAPLITPTKDFEVVRERTPKAKIADRIQTKVADRGTGTITVKGAGNRVTIKFVERSKAKVADRATAKVAETVKPKTSAPGDKSWGIQLAGNWSEAKALAAFEGLRKKHPQMLRDQKVMVVRKPLAGKGAVMNKVQIAMNTRASAEQLCSKLKGVGGACVVMRN
jgi:hypothetical protein